MHFDPDAPATGDGLFGLPNDPGHARVVVIPVEWQATTSYRRGTREGPKYLVEASRQVDLFDLDVGPAWKAGIAMLDPDPRIRAWDAEAEEDALAVIESGGGEPEAAARVNELSERVNAHVHGLVRDLLAQGRVPAVIGGDHSVPYGAMQAVAEAFPGVGILHIDAHADLRAAYEGFTWSHASVFHNVIARLPDVAKLVQVGIRDVGEAEVELIRDNPHRIATFFDNAIARDLARGIPWLTVVKHVIEKLPENVYVSIDVDGLDPAFCPHTGTPVPGGLSFRDAVVLLGTLAEERRIVGFDINEIGPDEYDGNVAARLLYKLCGWSVESQVARTKR